MKKLFWGAMYVLAAVMVALTIYLYVVPEGEIILGDDKLEQSTEQRPVPVVKVGGVEVEVGKTKLSALLDAGFRLMYEDSDGNFVPLQSDVTADAAMQYSLVLVKDNSYVASIKYSNANAYSIPLPSCTVDALTFNTEAEGYGKTAVELSGVDMTGGLAMGEVPDKFKDFTKASGDTEEYSKTVLTDKQFVIAYVRASDLQSDKVGEFGVVNYQPGDEGTGGGKSADAATEKTAESTDTAAETTGSETAAEESNGNH